MSTETTPTPSPGPGGIYNVHAAAAALGLTVGTLRRLVHDRTPSWLEQPTRLGNMNVWSAEQVDRMVQARAVLAANPPKRRLRKAKGTSALTTPAPAVTVTVCDVEPDADGFWG